MVRWVNAQQVGSPIAESISQAAQALWGDKLTPALKKEQLKTLQRENIGADEFSQAVRDWGGAAAKNPAPSYSPSPDKDSFLKMIAPQAASVADEIGLDPRLVVAQAALESGWGKSAPGNNLFGIKSHGTPGGNTLQTTEVIDGQPVQVTDSFRSYGSPADSVAGYGDFVTSNPRYAEMLSAPDLSGQIDALGRSGYATDPKYADKVRSIAEALDLSRYLPAATPSPMTGKADTRPGQYNPNNAAQMSAELLARGVQAGMSPTDIADAARMFTANVYGAENPEYVFA